MRDVKIILVLIFILIINSIYSNEKKINLKYEDIDWKNYRWWEKWYDFNPDVNYPESPKIDEYLNLEKKKILPDNVHIYSNDPIVKEYKEILLNQQSSIASVMFININNDKNKIINDEYEFDFTDYQYYARLINPYSIDFLIWLYNRDIERYGQSNVNVDGLFELSYFMTIDPLLFKEEIQYYKNKVVPLLMNSIKNSYYDIRILIILYRLGYEKEVMPIIIEASKHRRFEYQLLCDEYFSFKKNLRIAVAKPEIKDVVINLLNNLDELNLDTQYECILFLYFYGDLEHHIDYLFKIIDMKRYKNISLYMKFFELIPENEKVEKYFKLNIEKPEFKNFHEMMFNYIKSFSQKED